MRVAVAPTAGGRVCAGCTFTPAGVSRAVGEGCVNVAGASTVPCGVLWDGRAWRRAAVGGHEQRKGKEHRQLSVLWMCLQTQIKRSTWNLMAQVALIGRNDGR